MRARNSEFARQKLQRCGEAGHVALLDQDCGGLVFHNFRQLEVLALRHQVDVLKRKRPRPGLNCLDRLFWTTLCRYWSRWKDVLIIVMPDTVTGWHRAGFRLYWRWRSARAAVGQESPAKSAV